MITYLISICSFKRIVRLIIRYSIAKVSFSSSDILFGFPLDHKLNYRLVKNINLFDGFRSLIV